MNSLAHFRIAIALLAGCVAGLLRIYLYFTNNILYIVECRQYLNFTYTFFYYAALTNLWGVLFYGVFSAISSFLLFLVVVVRGAHPSKALDMSVFTEH